MPRVFPQFSVIYSTTLNYPFDTCQALRQWNIFKTTLNTHYIPSIGLESSWIVDIWTYYCCQLIFSWRHMAAEMTYYLSHYLQYFTLASWLHVSFNLFFTI